MSVEIDELTFEALGMRNIISVHSRDEFTASFRETPVELGHEPDVFSPAHPDAIVTVSQGF
jgi:hypothetical protein